MYVFAFYALCLCYHVDSVDFMRIWISGVYSRYTFYTLASEEPVRHCVYCSPSALARTCISRAPPWLSHPHVVYRLASEITHISEVTYNNRSWSGFYIYICKIHSWKKYKIIGHIYLQKVHSNKFTLTFVSHVRNRLYSHTEQ
jgi:hypothetical protein